MPLGCGPSNLNIMKTGYTAIVKKDGDWWIGWVEEVPGVNAQERTKEDLLISLTDRTVG
jgi:predicted RNase H-like HicB family nuclease